MKYFLAILLLIVAYLAAPHIMGDGEEDSASQQKHQTSAYESYTPPSQTAAETE